MYNDITLVRTSDLPKEFDLEDPPLIVNLLYVLGAIALIVGGLSFIFAPDKLVYHGSLTLFQMIYMAPGPVVSVGFFLVVIASQLSTSRLTKKTKEITERYALDPAEIVPEGSFLMIQQVEKKLFLVLAIAETQEEAATVKTDKPRLSNTWLSGGQGFPLDQTQPR